MGGAALMPSSSNRYNSDENIYRHWAQARGSGDCPLPLLMLKLLFWVNVSNASSIYNDKGCGKNELG